LPTSIGRIRFVQGPPDGACWATLVGRSATSTRVISDVSIRDAAGRPVAELRGIETHVRRERPR
jgi:hypothetical protein